MQRLRRGQVAAQRRPGFEPRRHPSLAEAASSLTFDAQRRPGFEPRRHTAGHYYNDNEPYRSTKAGVRTPATHVELVLEPELLDRSTKAGVRTPATRAPAVLGKPPGSATLNEGRGSNPGDTMSRLAWSCKLCHAQRRPGFEPRRHLALWGWRGWTECSLNEGRGSNPGDTAHAFKWRIAESYAQRRPGFEPRRHLQADRGGAARHPRSTKAGVRTPATHAYVEVLDALHFHAQRRPGFEPRRHLLMSDGPRVGICAQRRPGFEPRRHQSVRRAAGRPRVPLNEGRGSNPGDTANPIRESLPRKIAQICGHQIPCSHAD